jgi:hypothetical protein
MCTPHNDAARPTGFSLGFALAKAFLACGFVAAFSAIKVAQTCYTGYYTLRALCELLADFNGVALVVPLGAGSLAVWMHRNGRYRAMGVLVEALNLWSAVWCLVCLLLWELNELRIVGASGFKGG